jgi:tRNA/rRNA methyltransferase
MMSDQHLANVAVVLKQPHYSENIGAAARAVCNMGIGQLIVVNPIDYDLVKVMRLATHAALRVVDDMIVCDDLAEALGPYNYVIGTTARLGGDRQVVHTPRKMAKKLNAMLPNNKVAFLFGPEDRGLTNEDLRYCHELVNIPTAAFTSLNLAQAVMILGYELFVAQQKPSTTTHMPRLANRFELDGMYDQLKKVLVDISYVEPNNPDHFMSHLRHFLTRLQLRAKEVMIIRGLCRQIEWFGRKNFEDGKKQGTSKNSTPLKT